MWLRAKALEKRREEKRGGYDSLIEGRGGCLMVGNCNDELRR